MPTNVSIDADELKALLALRDAHSALQLERDALHSALRCVTVERDLAEERLRAYRRELFAAKSEARNSSQLGLFNEAEALALIGQPAEESTPQTKVAEHTRKKRGRKPLDPNLRREVIRHELPESERFCANDGHALVEIGVETSEQIDIIPEQIRVVQHQRVKYACPCCDLGIKVTPAPPRIIPRGLFTESALAWIAGGKYQFGMPIYRQAALLRRFGGDISSNTVAASMVRVGLSAQPVINLMRDALLDCPLIFSDETTFQVLKEPARRPQTKSYLWAQMNGGAGPPIRLFTYTPGRGGKHAELLFAGILPGTVLMSDGYELYNGIAHDYRLVHLGCWSHARRYFIKAEDAIPKSARSPDQLATGFVKLIAKLYAAEAHSVKWVADRRRRLRQRYSARVLGRIEKMLVEHIDKVVPGSLLGKALYYLFGQWPKLTRYVENGDWPISNNDCENAIRPFVVGRRGWLFSDTVDGANASANLYSLVETCKANRIEPYQYLAWLFRRLPLAKTVDDYDALLPWNMSAESR